jgi:hypothetical protein
MDEFDQDVEALPIDDVLDGGQTEKEGPGPQPAKESTIGDMARDGFVFFTPALITMYGLLDRDPVVEFNKTHHTTDDAERVFYIDCEYPFFTGLGEGLLGGQLVDWDHRIYGITGANWGPCKSFLEAISGFSAKLYHYFRIGTHELSIVDPTAFYGHGGTLLELPVIDLTVFCVSTNRSFSWIAPAKDPPRTMPYLYVDPPRPEIIPEAEAILGPPPAPEQIAKFREGLDAEDRDRIAKVYRIKGTQD